MSDERTHNGRPSVDRTAADTGPATGLSRLELMQKAIFAPFSHKKRDSARILSDLAPVIMTPRIIHSASTYSSRSHYVGGSAMNKPKMEFSTLGRAPARRITSRDLQIVEATDELLDAEVPELDGVASNVSLLRGFNATIPSAEHSRSRRRQLRNVETPRLGLKRLGLTARGMITNEDDLERQSAASEEDVVIVSRTDAGKKGKRRGRESLSTLKTLGREELTRQAKEIKWDKENLHVKTSLLHNEITEITRKIEALDSFRVKLEQDLLKLQEDELELDDELVGVQERLDFEEQQFTHAKAKPQVQDLHLPQSSRRRKGPTFLPSEHSELPPGVAFMTLESHTTPITALDFSEPYGTLVSASQEDAQPRVWDLLTGTEVGRLRGHRGTVKCLQVEDHVCLTGGEDGNVRLWDLRRVDDDDIWSLPDVTEDDEEEGDEELTRLPNGIRNGVEEDVVSVSEREGPCARILEGHSKAVTALFFEDECLVTGASDKTLRQWDLTTGQCVMTMDILWAISHSPQPGSSRAAPSHLCSSPAGTFAVPTPPYADSNWEVYEDFVGGVQFWGYGLVSGSGDGAVRMWDMRTGQAHRTLMGHSAPVSCLQFDEIHIASGSLDKTIHLWDLRTGGILETIQFNHAVTGLQFDTRKVVAATKENGIKIYNRTSTQQSTLYTNGHTKSVERVRYMDRYLVSGGRDSMLKIWSL